MLNLRSIFLSDSRAAYDLVPSDEDFHRDVSSVSLHSQEKSLSRRTERRRRKNSHALALIAGVVIGVVLGAVSMALRDYLKSRRWPISDQPTKTFAPEMPLTTVVFEEKPELVDPPNKENQKYWDGLLPIGRGFVNISTPEEYGFQPGIPTDSGVDRYSVAMFHQLHCLGLLRFAYWRLMDGMSGNWSDAEREKEYQKQLHDHHTQHCFAYITESIKCSADLTIEWARIERDGRRKQVDGWGIPHQCKDPKAIWAWMESVHGPTKGGDVHLHSLSGMKQNSHKTTHT